MTGKKAESVVLSRRVELRHEVDVFVAGGGPAGVAAAVAAARQGASVFLAERHTCLGGMGTAGLVPAFMEYGDGINFLAAGVGGEVLDRLHAAGGAYGYTPEKRGGCVNINSEVLKRVYDSMLTDAGVLFTFQTPLVAVEADEGRVTSVICAAKSGLFAVRAGMYVDGTGDADLCAWAGATFEKGDSEGRMQPGTLCQKWVDIDWDAVKAGYGIEGDGSQIGRGIDAGLFTIPDRGLPGIWPVGDGIGGANVGHTFGVDGTDERSVSKALVWGRKLVREYERYYKEYLRGFEHMTLVETGSLLGLRESRRIVGDYTLTLEDYMKRAVFDDEIGRYAYAIDVHASRPNDKPGDASDSMFKTHRYAKGESYGIPYRILVPRGVHNVLAAGRCVSADRYVHGSLRVMPGCFITGQASGTAAALAALRGVGARAVPIRDLQIGLCTIGAYLPNVSLAENPVG